MIEAAYKIPLKIKGVIGARSRCHFVFTYLNNIKHGTYSTKSSTTMCRLCLRSCTCSRDVNTTKQNKNKFLFAWLACLVEWRVFEEAMVSFLPVGHTHEDRSDVLVSGARSSQARQAFHTHKHGEAKGMDLTTAANISDWLKPCSDFANGGYRSASRPWIDDGKKFHQ